MPDSIKWLALIGGVCMILTGLSGLRTGWLYERRHACSPIRKVYRVDEPFLYWTNFAMRIAGGGVLAVTGLIFLLRR